MLGVPAARQIVSKMNASEREKEEMVDKLERSCNKFDHSKAGALTINEYWNICRVQNRINVSKDEVTTSVFTAPQSHLNLEQQKLFQVNAIMSGLPQDEEGRIRIEDFINTDIYSEEVFEVLGLV